VVRLLAALAGQSVTVVKYQELLDSPELPLAFVEQCAAHLDDSLTRRISPQAAAPVLDRDLHHEPISQADLGEHLTSRQARLWDYLASLPGGDVLVSPGPGLCSLPGFTRSSLRAERERVQTAQQLATLRQELRDVRAEAHEMEAVRLRELLDAELIRGAEARQRLACVQMSLSWRITRPLRALRRLWTSGDRSNVELG
jgi:hypothetical protein